MFKHQRCTLKVDYDFFLTELDVLAEFTHRVTLPLLNCVEICNQKELIPIFQNLYKDLSNSDMSTLDYYRVHYPHLQAPQISTDLEKKILTATTIKLQCGREYGFSDPTDHSRAATKLHLLTDEGLDDLPTNNLECERDLSYFSRCSDVAKYRNLKFKAKQIRSNCTLYKADLIAADKLSGKINMALKLWEDIWTDEQKLLNNIRIVEKGRKGQQQKLYVHKLLDTCKSWHGPCTAVDELLAIISAHPDKMETIVKTELSYYKHTHAADVTARPELFRLRKISHEERLENLCILLEDIDHISSVSSDDIAINLPSNEDALAALNVIENNPPTEPLNCPTPLAVGDLCVTVWQQGWYLGDITDIELLLEGDTLIVDHLERANKSNKVWQYPKTKDSQDIQLEQVLNYVPTGEWDY